MTHSRAPSKRKTPRVAVLNDSALTLSTIAKWFEIHGYGVATARLSEMRVAHLDVEHFVQTHRPDVIVYDVAMPYESNWDFLDVIRMLPALAGLPIVVTTSNKDALEELVGPTDTLQIVGKPDDLNALIARVEAATSR